MIDKNFAILGFGTWSRVNLVNTAGDLVILNLVTRTPFWMQRSMIATQIIEKTGRVELDDLRITNVSCSIKVDDDRVVIQFRVKMNSVFDTSALLGWFSKNE